MTDGGKRNEAVAAAELDMATSRMEKMQSYLARGRKLEHVEPDDLERLFVESNEAMSRNLDDVAARTRADEANCEYELRGEEAPFHLVKEAVDRFCEAVAAGIESLDDDRKNEINSAIMSQYHDAQTKKN